MLRPPCALRSAHCPDQALIAAIDENNHSLRECFAYHLRMPLSLRARSAPPNSVRRRRLTSYAIVPLDRLTTFRSRPARKAAAPPLASNALKSDRCTATWLIVPSVSTSTTFQPSGLSRMT